VPKIRYFKCPITKCGTVTGFDVGKIGQVEDNILVCSGCKKKYAATKLPGCCNVNVLFVSVESGTKKRITSLQTFTK
jgi:hypothetical protein